MTARCGATVRGSPGVYRRHDGRWQWFPQIGDCKTGACGGKEVAKAELERCAALFPVNNR